MSRVESRKMDEFIIKFNKNKRTIKVVLHDVSIETFQKHGGGRWGYYEHKNNGKELGEIHLILSRVREDLVAHELIHALLDWIRTDNIRISTRNEEKLAVAYDEMFRNFYKGYYKLWR